MVAGDGNEREGIGGLNLDVLKKQALGGYFR